MKKNRTLNTIGITEDPVSFEEMYKGRCNNLPFKLVYSGSWNAYSEEVETSVNVMWDGDEPQRAKQLEEGIRKVFRNRLNARRNKE